MTPKERELILSVAARLRNANLTEKDPEAEALIRQEVGGHPDAVYLLTQAVILQEYGLDQAQQRIASLEKQVQQVRQQASNAAPKQASSFLGGMFGGGQQSPSPSASPPPSGGKQQAGKQQAPSRPVPGMGGGTGAVPGSARMAGGAGGHPAASQASQAGPAGGGFGGFMRSAAAMAVGVAGGHLLFNGLSNMFGDDEATAADTAGAEGDTANTDPAAETDPTLADDAAASTEETTADTAADDAGGGWGMDDDSEAETDADIDLPPEEPPAEYADAFGNDPFGDEGGMDDASGFEPAPAEEDPEFGGGFDDGGDFGGDDDSWG